MFDSLGSSDGGRHLGTSRAHAGLAPGLRRLSAQGRKRFRHPRGCVTYRCSARCLLRPSG